MSHIHFAGAILQSTQVQRQQEAARARDLRRQEELEEEIALQDDQLEHQVEGTEELTRTRHANNEEDPHPGRNSHDLSSSDEQTDPPHIDLTA